jgi:hypothetical protein
VIGWACRQEVKGSRGVDVTQLEALDAAVRWGAQRHVGTKGGGGGGQGG